MGVGIFGARGKGNRALFLLLSKRTETITETWKKDKITVSLKNKLLKIIANKFPIRIEKNTTLPIKSPKKGLNIILCNRVVYQIVQLSTTYIILFKAVFSLWQQRSWKQKKFLTNPRFPCAANKRRWISNVTAILLILNYNTTFCSLSFAVTRTV